MGSIGGKTAHQKAQIRRPGAAGNVAVVALLASVDLLRSVAWLLLEYNLLAAPRSIITGGGQLAD